jgi:hypothetical protein
MLNADIALDMSVAVHKGEPLKLKGTVMGLVLREMKARIVSFSETSARNP